MQYRLLVRQIVVVIAISLLSIGIRAEEFESTLQLGDSKLIVFADVNDDLSISPQAIDQWVLRSAKTLQNFYGVFPVSEAYIALQTRQGKGVLKGKAMGFGSASINIWLGHQTTETDLYQDWIMVHEMAHFALPKMADKHEWLEEGLATYVEAVARTASGLISAEQLWQHFLQNMPNGLPEAGDQGLDNTPTWGRIYWGGALFCLLADIEIRQQTGGKKSLRDALAGIIKAGYSFLDDGEPLKILQVADQATNTKVLTNLYLQHRDKAVKVDLSALWQKLGIEYDQQSQIRFNQDAPWSAIRAEIGAP